MKIKWFIITLFALTGCVKPSKTNLNVIEISKSYPDKTIKLSDIADISYVQLDDSNEDFLFRGGISTVSSNYFVTANYSTGNIYFFTKDGKPKFEFNRTGNGPEEYNFLMRFFYDEENDDLFTLHINKMHIYTSNGEYKRTLFFPKRTRLSGEYAILDNSSLVLYDALNQHYANMIYQNNMNKTEIKREAENTNDRFSSSFIRVSRLDGDIEEYINIPEDFYDVDLTAEWEDLRVSNITSRILPHNEGLLLHNQETDTVFLYRKDHTISPFLIQSPSVKDMNPGVYIRSVVDIPNYLFIELNTLKALGIRKLMTNYLVRDKNDGMTYRSKIIFEEYKGKEFFINRETVLPFQDTKEGLISLPVDEVLEAYENNLLSGELKKFVESMDKENENDVLLLLRFK